MAVTLFVAAQLGCSSDHQGSDQPAASTGGSFASNDGHGGGRTTVTDAGRGGTAAQSAVGTGGVAQVVGGAFGQGGATTVVASGGVNSSATNGGIGGRATADVGSAGRTSGGGSTPRTNPDGGVGNGGVGNGGTAAGGRINVGGAATVGATGGRTGTSSAPIGGRAAGGASTSRTSIGGATNGGATLGTTANGGSTTNGSSVTLDCPGATTVITVGSGQQYATLKAAIASISSSNSKLVQVSLKAGTYNEQVTIDKPFVCLTGESAQSTIITNTAGTSITTGGTVMVTGNDFSAANITFENTAGNGAGQAVALMAKGLRQQFRNCRFLSYQDTVYTNTGTQYFRDCYVQGDVDFIFGDATAVFENCTMNNVAEGTAVVAPRTPQNATYGLVFLGGSLTASPTTSSVRSNHVYLGRPWGPYAAAAFLRVEMGAHIAAAGWTTMSDNDLTNTRFREYRSTGPGANTTDSTRASRQLSDAEAANYTVKNVLSPWVPSYGP